MLADEHRRNALDRPVCRHSAMRHRDPAGVIELLPNLSCVRFKADIRHCNEMLLRTKAQNTR